MFRGTDSVRFSCDPTGVANCESQFLIRKLTIQKLIATNFFMFYCLMLTKYISADAVAFAMKPISYNKGQVLMVNANKVIK